MANSDFDWGRVPTGPDLPVTNTGDVDMVARQIVVLDTAQTAPGTHAVKLPTADGGGIAILVEDIPRGRTGRAQIYGIAVGIADGAVGRGARVRGSNTRPGGAKACTPGQAQFGYALQAAADGEPVQILIDRANNA
ncbi:hypothetical protein LZC95_19830 [Pendulispora brunnea]|uniref:Uncharacterized protein n=1 Tax=Pendulispora brunnea TaxID=2905690 RepID=A0ABZ2KKJ6_9BACT